MWAFPPWVLPMHMRGFSHVYYAHFIPRILCVFLHVGMPTMGLPMHNMRLFSHVYYAHFFLRIKCVGKNVDIPTVGFAHA